MGAEARGSDAGEYGADWALNVSGVLTLPGFAFSKAKEPVPWTLLVLKAIQFCCSQGEGLCCHRELLGSENPHQADSQGWRHPDPSLFPMEHPFGVWG